MLIYIRCAGKVYIRRRRFILSAFTLKITNTTLENTSVSIMIHLSINIKTHMFKEYILKASVFRFLRRRAVCKYVLDDSGVKEECSSFVTA